MALIPDLPAASSLSNTDLFVIDTGSATKKITVSDLISSILPLTTGTITPAAGWTLSSASYLKKWGGHIVEFYAELTGGTYSVNGWNDVATLPSGFIPSTSYDYTGLDNGASTQAGLALDCKVSSLGTLRVYKSLSMTPTNNIRLHGTFIV